MLRNGCAAVAVILSAGGAGAEPAHGIAMYGAPALPPDFVSLPYANPNAPKGGKIVTGETGSFDSLNPHIAKGRVPWQLRFIAYESLMGRSYDEPFTLYGLLAESVETGPNREWVEFTLRPEARFSDGAPVTVEDVIWSYETLGTIGHPRYHGTWSKVASAEQTGPRSVRFTFNVDDRELALIMGMRPILKKAQWDGVPFDESGTDNIPISSAPYVITDFKAGRFVELTRNPDYWGADVPFRRGTNNIDTVRMEFFADGNAMFEAFKAGILTSHRETNAAKWASSFDFPAIRDGDVVKSEIAHRRPSGMRGYVFNTRREIFADWRVRSALIHAFNYEFISKAINADGQPRVTSYFSNSVLGMSDGPAEGRVRDFLEPFADELLPGALEGYSLPVSDGSLDNRRNLRKAVGLLSDAGWNVGDDGVLRNGAGDAFTFDILLNVGAGETEKTMDIYVEALKRLGIEATILRVDGAEYRAKTDTYDYDMIYYTWGLSLSPGNEQFRYWGADGVTEPGSRNRMGINSPAAEAMINELLNANSREDFLAAVHALDRILTTGRYVIPVWFSPVSTLAHDKNLRYPDVIPAYGDWIGFQPDVWWYAED